MDIFVWGDEYEHLHAVDVSTVENAKKSFLKLAEEYLKVYPIEEYEVEGSYFKDGKFKTVKSFIDFKEEDIPNFPLSLQIKARELLSARDRHIRDHEDLVREYEEVVTEINNLKDLDGIDDIIEKFYGTGEVRSLGGRENTIGVE